MDKEQHITYYGAFPLKGGRPSAVFRFFAEGKKLPQRFVPNVGWIEDDRLLLKRMSGDLGPAEELSEEVAANFIHALSSNKAS